MVHVLTQKGRGYAPAEEDEVQRLHDVKVVSRVGRPGEDAGRAAARRRYTDAFTRALARARPSATTEVVALTAAMPGPTGLLPFQARFPDRFFDVGIAEQHEMTAAAGMAMGGLRPVVAVYSTFFSRAFDQANLDVGPAPPARRLRPRPGRDHRRRRAEPPRRARPRPVPCRSPA